MDLKTFIEEYNKRTDWNQEIISVLSVTKNELDELDYAIGGFIDTDKITEEGYDFDSAEIYEDDLDSNGKKLFELQIYSFEHHCTQYFWVRNETEAEYRDRIINGMDGVVVGFLKDIDKKLKDLETKRSSLSRFMDKLGRLTDETE
jgi:hypothetical protein